jgi:clan AA aspartic protease (TIGR02281 family)
MSRQLKSLLAGVALAVMASACAEAPPPQVQTRTVYVPTPVANTQDGVRVKLYGSGGVAYIPAIVNNSYRLPFVLDSGAADVSIAPQVAKALIDNGTLTREDMIDVANYGTADGRVVEGIRLRLKSVQVGTMVADNVVASVSPTTPLNGMLLGQSFLRKFKHWSIDNERRELVLSTNE